MNFAEMTIRAFHSALCERKVTCKELVGYYLDRINRFDKKGPEINAVITVNSEALHIADMLDAQFCREGMKGPLFGVPVLMKDNVNTLDMPTTGGSSAFEGLMVSDDAFIVKKLRQAGAIILAKVNLSEFACTGETLGSLIGQTKNPYDLHYTPGGSSGGTGAGLAANYGLVGIGNDCVNSIRSPASACSLVGIRPTRGLVGRTGIIPHSCNMDTAGPLARTVEDAARVLEAIAGFDEQDPVTAWCAGQDASYSNDLNAPGLRGIRIGLVRSMLGNGPEHREVNELVEQALAVLAGLGAEIVDYRDTVDIHDLLANVNVQSYDQAAEITAYIQKFARHSPYRNFDELLASGKVVPWVVDNRLRKAAACSGNIAERDSRLRKMAEYRDRVMYMMVRQRLDVLVYPMQQQLVARIGESQAGRNGILAAVTGFPAITVPAGFSAATPTAPIGIPVGIEFFGRPFSERLLIRLAFAYEQATHNRKPPVSTPL